jgi:hypothetical protein
MTVHADGVATEEDVAELVALLLDDLGPSLQWYRDEVGRGVDVVAGLVQALHVRARGMADAADERRRLAARRRAREADPITPWWTR